MLASVATLRKDTGLAQRTVQYRLRSLVARGLVSCEERRGATTVLRLRRSEPCISAAPSGVQDAAEKGRDMHPPVHELHATGAPDAPEVTKELPLNRQEERHAEKLSTTPANQSQVSNETKEDRAVRGAWWTSHAGIDAKGRELQVPPRLGEAYTAYKDRLFVIEREQRRRHDCKSEENATEPSKQ